MTDRRLPISTLALLAAVGVEGAASAQTFDELPVTSSGSSAGIKVTNDFNQWATLPAPHAAGPGTAFGGLVSGVGLGWLPRYPDAFTEPLTDGLPLNQARLWCHVAGSFSESPGFGSLDVMLRPALLGSFAVGWGSSNLGTRFSKDGSVVDIDSPDETGTVSIVDANADGEVAVGSVKFSKKKASRRHAGAKLKRTVVGKNRGKMVSRTAAAESRAEDPLLGAPAPSGVPARAMVWQSGVSTYLDTLPSHATCVSPDAVTIGGMIDSGTEMIWARWQLDAGVYVAAPPASAIPGTLRGVSDNGDHLVGQLADGQAAAWIEGTGLMTFGMGDALAVADDGSVVVGTNATRTEAWIWTSADGTQSMSSFMAGLGLPPSSLPMLAAAGLTSDGTAMTGWMGAVDHVETDDAPAFPPFGSTPATSALTISGTLDGTTDAHDVYAVMISDPDQFYATTSAAIDARASAGFDTRLWLFDNDGYLVLANDDGPDGAPFHSTISDPADFTALTGGIVAETAPPAIAPGNYYLVISGFPENPLDETAVTVADLDSDFDALHGVNPLSSGFLQSWQNEPFTGAAYTIALRGVTPTLPQQGWVLELDQCPADLDDNGLVDFGDLLILLGGWGGPEGDINDDGVTDFGDLLILLGDWGPCEVGK